MGAPEAVDRCGADEDCAGFDWAVGCGRGTLPGERTWLGYSRTSDPCREASAPCGPAVRGAAHVVHFHTFTHEARVRANHPRGGTATPGARRNDGRSGVSGRLAGSQLCAEPSRRAVVFFSEQAAAPEPLTPQMILFSLPPRPARGSWADGTRESRPCVSPRDDGRTHGVGLVVVSQVRRQVAAALLSSTAARRDARRATSAHAARAPRGRARHIDRARAVRRGRAAALRVPSRL